MKKLQKIGALILALAMVAMVGTGYAVDLDNGAVGGFTDYDSEKADTTAENSKQTLNTTVNLKKELVVYNANGSTVYAPEFSYTYTVTPASVSNMSVTDTNTVHASNSAVTAPVNAGITTGLKVCNGTAGGESSAVGTLAFTNTTQLDSSANGTGDGVNTYDISLDFSGVTFPQAGVYRYAITEALADSATYDGLGMVNGNTNTLYLDVYVDGDCKIYGYVCMATNDSVTTASEKTNGFVTTSQGQDSYYTYDLTLSKIVENDAYAKSTTAFPFTVIFNKPDDLTGSFAITETAETGSTGFNPTAGSANWRGVAKVKDGADITYTGIPCGVDVDVYETNISTGATYSVSTVVNNGDAVTDANVTWGTTPTQAVAQTTRENSQSTKQTVDTTLVSAIDAEQTVAITNTLILISPTGYVARFAPYALMLIGGIALLLVAKKQKKHTDEE